MLKNIINTFCMEFVFRVLLAIAPTNDHCRSEPRSIAPSGARRSHQQAKFSVHEVGVLYGTRDSGKLVASREGLRQAAGLPGVRG